MRVVGLNQLDEHSLEYLLGEILRSIDVSSYPCIMHI